LLSLDLVADGLEEGVEVGVEIIFTDVEVPVEEEEELLLHEVDFGSGETEVLVASDFGVLGPMLVLG